LIFKKANQQLKENNMKKVINKKTSEKCNCLYCGEKSDSIDPRVLCKDCRETFGHTFFEEL
jgi:hypothetical protein